MDNSNVLSSKISNSYLLRWMVNMVWSKISRWFNISNLRSQFSGFGFDVLFLFKKCKKVFIYSFIGAIKYFVQLFIPRDSKMANQLGDWGYFFGPKIVLNFMCFLVLLYIVFTEILFLFPSKHLKTIGLMLWNTMRRIGLLTNWISIKMTRKNSSNDCLYLFSFWDVSLMYL